MIVITCNRWWLMLVSHRLEDLKPADRCRLQLLFPHLFTQQMLSFLPLFLPNLTPTMHRRSSDRTSLGRHPLGGPWRCRWTQRSQGSQWLGPADAADELLILLLGSLQSLLQLLQLLLPLLLAELGALEAVEVTWRRGVRPKKAMVNDWLNGSEMMYHG